MFYGALCCLTIFPLCIVAGVWQIAAGFIMIVLGNLLYSDVITMPSIWDIREDFDSGKIKYSQLSSNDESNDVEI